MEEPVDVNVEVTLDSKGTEEPLISIYEGNIEDNILIKSYFINTGVTEVNLKVNRKYTFTARYEELGGNICVVVNSVYPRVRYETNQCEEPCYYVYDKKVKLKLKYTNY